MENDPRVVINQVKSEIKAILKRGQPIWLFDYYASSCTIHYSAEITVFALGIAFPLVISQAAVSRFYYNQKARYEILAFKNPQRHMAAAAVRASPIPSAMSVGNKRKRGLEELGRNVKAATANTEQEPNYASLLQGIDSVTGDDSTRTAQAALAGALDNGGYPEPGFDGGSGMNTGFGDNSTQNLGDASGQGYGTPGQTPNKPAVGTPQWHQQRKENHKEGRYSRPCFGATY